MAPTLAFCSARGSFGAWVRGHGCPGHGFIQTPAASRILSSDLPLPSDSRCACLMLSNNHASFLSTICSLSDASTSALPHWPLPPRRLRPPDC